MVSSGFFSGFGMTKGGKYLGHCVRTRIIQSTMKFLKCGYSVEVCWFPIVLNLM